MIFPCCFVPDYLGADPLQANLLSRRALGRGLRISHLRIDGGVLVSNNTLEPLRDCANGTEDPSDPGLGGRRDCRRLEGFPPGTELLENIIAN